MADYIEVLTNPSGLNIYSVYATADLIPGFVPEHDRDLCYAPNGLWRYDAGGAIWNYVGRPSVIANTVVVAKSGGDYDTIEDGVAAANLIVGAGQRALVRVYPGDYYENNPIQPLATVSLYAPGSHETTRLFCLNPNANGIEFVNDSEAIGIQVRGASGPGAAGFYVPATAEDIELHDCKIRDCDVGVLCLAPAATSDVLVRQMHVSAGTCTDLFRCNAGGFMYVDGVSVSEQATITNVFRVDGAGSYLISTAGTIRGNLTTRVALVTNGGTLEVQTLHADGCAEGYVIDAGDGQLNLGACELTNVAGDHIRTPDSAGSTVHLLEGYYDPDNFNIGAATVRSGNFQSFSLTRPGPTTMGELYLGLNTTEQIPLTSYMRSTASTAWVSGGICTALGGLDLSVALGSGFINTGTGVVHVGWGTQPITVPANAEFHIYVDTSGVAHSSPTEPSLDSVILLASGYADATDVVFLGVHVVPAQYFRVRHHHWVQACIGSLWVSGLAMTKLGGPPSLQVVSDGGSYYQTDVLVNAAASASPCEWTYWWLAGATWNVIASVTSFDDAQYNTGGALGAMPAGEWKKECMCVVVSDGVTQRNVVYATATYASQALAEAAPVPTPPAIFAEMAMPMWAVVIQQGSGDITSFLDERPQVVTAGPGTAPTPALHAALSNLTAPYDDHTQYMLLSGDSARNAMTGVLNISGGGLTLPVSAAPVQIIDGRVVWDSALKVLTVGDGVSRKTMVDTNSAQNLASKTLVTPTIASFVNATHDHSDAAGGGLVVQATESQRGGLQVATQVQTDAGLLDTVAVTPLKLAGWPLPAHDHSGAAGTGGLTVQATESQRGGLQVATQVQTDAGLLDTVAVTPLKLTSLAAYIPGLVVHQLQTTTGPTNLVVGAVADGEYLRRSGATIVSGVPTSTPPPGTLVGVSSTITTTSLTDVVATGMTTTPAAGTYRVEFTGSVGLSANGSSAFMSICVNGVAQPTSTKEIQRGTQPRITPFACVAHVTVGGADVVTGEWRVTAGTGTMQQGRTIDTIRIT